MGGALLLLSNCFHLLSEAVILSRQSARTPDLRDFLNFIVCFTLVFQPFCDLFARQTENNRKQRDACLHIFHFFIRTSLHSLNIRPSKKKNTITVIEAGTFFWLASHINRGLQQYVGVASDLTARLRWPSGIHLLSLSSLLLPLIL